MLRGKAARRERLLPKGKPRWIRCYDNGGETTDRYTVVYTRLNTGYCSYVGMSEHPTWPNGVGQHGESQTPIDRPSYGHLGRRIGFDDLPADCQGVVLHDYCEMWSLELPQAG